MLSCSTRFYLYIIPYCFLCFCTPLHADTKALMQNNPSQEILNTQDSLYNSLPTDSIKEAPLPKDPSLLQMQQDQMDLMRKEFHGNPAQTDLIYYKQNEAQKEIQKDSTLKIKPEYSTYQDSIAQTEQHEFIMQYFFKIVDEIPYGEDYKISVPLHMLGLQRMKTPSRTCEINTKEHSLPITHYNHYTKAEMQASIRKQTQYLLYNLLQEYKAEVLECLMLNQAYLDDTNTALNLESRTKTITSVRSYVLVDFHGGILTLQVFNPPNKKH
ncbi:hypothetical protein LS80_005200 [Helicobacter trogontum]|uniref:Periplasmic protein n=2 Tax=Helicobacter trogontum TaxID=50960 RepID=A0A4U8TE49_9HELI|nr:hypothetical protein LS80_005200 [Helicobacter trogontum]